MKYYWLKICIIVVLLGLLPGCYDKMYLEDATLILVLGFDIEEDRFIVYSSSPLFNKDAKKKTEEFYDDKPVSVRHSKNNFDTMSSGIPSAGKIQTILIGKKLLEHGNWFSMLDTLFRNAESSVNANVAVVNGPVSEVVYYHADDKPPLTLLLPKLISSSSKKNATLDTTLQEFHRQMYDQAMTPALPMIRKNTNLVAEGAALLNEQGKYVTSLDLQETTLLRVLQRNLTGVGSYTANVPESQAGQPNPIVQSKLSVDIAKLSVRIRTSYEHGRFIFNLRYKMKTRITERTFPFNTTMRKTQLQKQLDSLIQRDLMALIHKIQKNCIDPIGLGIIAQAYQYHAWKKVKDHWGDALSEADIRLSVKTEMLDSGVLQ
ncbi:Ger(x)C family spore germination protein [Paenibacillus terrigena]|uniref:Ger(x)C family spore germination protein n=1 Tax=Paenibacillus terrigena TaxID=369333 RepID=UPI00037FFCE8|nr:Ger(x)C family spore germination protein [Paenibacillus terrigena]